MRATAAGDPLPLGDVLELSQDLRHHRLVEEGPLSLLRLFPQLGGGLLQAAEGLKDRSFLSHVTAVKASRLTGKGQGLLVEKGVGGTADMVVMPAIQTGDGQIGVVGLHLHQKGGAPAGTGQPVGRGGQLKNRAVHHYALPALGAEISYRAFWLFCHLVSPFSPAY